MKIKFVTPFLVAALIFTALLPAQPAQAAYDTTAAGAVQSISPADPPPPPPGPTPPGPTPPSPRPPQPHPNPYPYYTWGSWYNGYPSWVGTYRWYVKPVTPVIVTTESQYYYAPVISSFTANPSYIQPWESATLVWNVSDASNVLISPSVGSVSNSGSFTVQPAYTTTYTLTATNSGGTVSASTTITVAPVVTAYSTTSTTDPYVSGSYTTDIVSGTASSSSTINPWLWYALLIALLAVAAAVIIYLARRKPAAAYAGTRAGSYSAATDVSTGTGVMHTTPAAAGYSGRLVSPGGSQVDLSSRLGALGRNDFKPMVPAHRADLISRKHIMIDFEDGRYYVEDRGSTNGTRLNGSAIKGTGRHILRDGDSIELGNVLTFTFKS